MLCIFFVTFGVVGMLWVSTYHKPDEISDSRRIEINDSGNTASVINSLDDLVEILNSKDNSESRIYKDNVKNKIDSEYVSKLDDILKARGYTISRNRSLVLDTFNIDGNLVIIKHYNDRCICSYVKEVTLEQNEVVEEEIPDNNVKIEISKPKATKKSSDDYLQF